MTFTTEYASFHRIIIAFVLSAIRIGAAMEILPAMSSSMITGLARRAAVVAFAALAVPMTLNQMPPYESLTMGVLAPVAIKEVIVGLIIGFFAAVPFWIAENVGNFIDNQRGATMGEVYSPLSGAQVSTTGIFFTQIVSTVFYVSGAVLVFLGAIYASWRFIPIFSTDIAMAAGTPRRVGFLPCRMKTFTADTHGASGIFLSFMRHWQTIGCGTTMVELIFCWLLTAMARPMLCCGNVMKHSRRRLKMPELVEWMTRIGNTAVHNAQEKNRRLGIANVYVLNGKMVWQLPNGELSVSRPQKSKCAGDSEKMDAVAH